MPKRTKKPSAPLVALRPRPEDYGVVIEYVKELKAQGVKINVSARLRPSWERLVKEARAWKVREVAKQERQPDKQLAS